MDFSILSVEHDNLAVGLDAHVNAAGHWHRLSCARALHRLVITQTIGWGREKKFDPSE